MTLSLDMQNENSLFDILANQLRQQEGLRLKAYTDTNGYLTIGYGHRLLESTTHLTERTFDDIVANGITKVEAEVLLLNDMSLAINESRDIIFNFSSINFNRQSVIANMIFNLGIAGFSQFKKTIAAIEKENFVEAAKDMLNSEWAKQVGERAIFLAKLMEFG